MIYFTGDIHGDVRRVIYDIDRFGIQRGDTIVILGDAGLNYFGNDGGDRRNKEFLNSQGITVFCIHGNHEMRPEKIESYHTTVWNGGEVFVEDDFPNLLFAKDGEIFDLGGYTAIVIGGAYSVDKFYRLQRGYGWFADEQPSDEVKTAVESKLDSIGWMVDCVLSHTCPDRYIPTEAFLPGLDQSTVDRSTENWLGKIEKRLTYGYWFCGHWHIDKRVDDMHFLMKSYEVLPEMQSYSIPVDEEVLSGFLDFCAKNHTTADLMVRSFFRFCIKPENLPVLKRMFKTAEGETPNE